jgi:hypothetical protein
MVYNFKMIQLCFMHRIIFLIFRETMEGEARAWYWKTQLANDSLNP